MNYQVLGLNDSSTEDDMKKAYRSLSLLFHPDKNQHSQESDVMEMINEAKEELENTLRGNDAIREKERVRMDAVREEERVRMSQNTIIISYESSSSDYSLETLSAESSDSGGRQIPTKPVISSNKASTFCPHSCHMTRRKYCWMTHLILVQGKNQQIT